MNKTKIFLSDNAYNLLNPGAVTLISVGDGKSDNLFALTWNMPISKSPGMMAILSDKNNYSYQFIKRTGEFGVNIPSLEIAEAVLGCGRTTGRKVSDKFSRFGLTRQPSENIKAPLVLEAVGNLECRVNRIIDVEGSALIIAEIVAAMVAKAHYKEGGWHYKNGLALLHHITANRFTTSNFQIDVELKK